MFFIKNIYDEDFEKYLDFGSQNTSLDLVFLYKPVITVSILLPRPETHTYAAYRLSLHPSCNRFPNKDHRGSYVL